MRNYYLLLCCGVLAAASMQAAPCTAHTAALTFYVSTSGQDTSDGTTPGTAFRSIQRGVDCLAVPGDKLLIFPGTYTELIRIGNKKGDPARPIILEGLPGKGGEPGVTILGTITRLPDSDHTRGSCVGHPSMPRRSDFPTSVPIRLSRVLVSQ